MAPVSGSCVIGLSYLYYHTALDDLLSTLSANNKSKTTLIWGTFPSTGYYHLHQRSLFILITQLKN